MRKLFERFFEWTLLVTAVLLVFLMMATIKNAVARDYGDFWEPDRGGRWMDPAAPMQHHGRRPHSVFQERRSTLYGGGDDPYYYGPIDQQPDLIIYQGRRRR